MMHVWYIHNPETNRLVESVLVSQAFTVQRNALAVLLPKVTTAQLLRKSLLCASDSQSYRARDVVVMALFDANIWGMAPSSAFSSRAWPSTAAVIS